MGFISLGASFLGSTTVRCMCRTIVFAGFSSFLWNEEPLSRLQCQTHRMTMVFCARACGTARQDDPGQINLDFPAVPAAR